MASAATSNAPAAVQLRDRIQRLGERRLREALGGRWRQRVLQAHQQRHEPRRALDRGALERGRLARPVDQHGVDAAAFAAARERGERRRAARELAVAEGRVRLQESARGVLLAERVEPRAQVLTRGGADDRRREIALQQAVVQQRQQQLVGVIVVVIVMLAGGRPRGRAHLRPRRPALRRREDGRQRLDELRLVHLVERGLRVKALLRAGAQPADDAGAAQRRRRDAQPRARAQRRVVEQRAGETLHSRPSPGARCAAGVPVAIAVRSASVPMHTPASSPCGVARNAARRAYRSSARSRRAPAGARASDGLASWTASEPRRARRSARAPRQTAATGSSGARRRKRGRGRYTPAEYPSDASRRSRYTRHEAVCDLAASRYACALVEASEPRPAKAGRGRRPKAAG